MKRMFASYPGVVSINELMLMLNIGKNTAYNLLQSGDVKSIKVGKQYRILKRYNFGKKASVKEVRIR